MYYICEDDETMNTISSPRREGKAMNTRIIWLAVVLVSALLPVSEGRCAYVPPVGIPAPPFGIDETAPAWPSAWPSGEAPGYYYVDKDHAAATDTGNVYGTPNKPRVSIPTTLAAGSYVEIHNSAGGAYTGSAALTITTSGTPSNPVWIRGQSAGSKPTIQRELYIRGSYAIYENLYFNVDRKDVSISASDHISFRNSEMAGPGINSGNTSAIGINSSNHIVIYNNRIHDWGDVHATVQNDYHGIKPSASVDNVWILNNVSYNMGGDSVQVGGAGLSGLKRPNYIYIGGNEFHDNLENAIDIKKANHVIISGNTCYNYFQTSSSAGEAIVIHNLTNYVWVLNNRVFQSTYGIITTGSVNTYFVGNLIYNITHSGAWDPTNAYQNGAAIHVRGTSGPTYIVSNTLYGNDIGIQSPAQDVRIFNNIISNRKTADGNDIHLGSAAAGSDMDYNLLYYGGGSARIRWGDGTSRSVAGFKAAYPKGANCPPESSPVYVDPVLFQFDIAAGSPAIDSGIMHSVYDAYFGLYGVSIRKDILGRSRPLGSRWDIGSHESEGTDGVIRVPKAPTGILIN
jgi:hypothetical protein